MILAEEGIVERGQTADHVEARVLDLLDDDDDVTDVWHNWDE